MKPSTLLAGLSLALPLVIARATPQSTTSSVPAPLPSIDMDLSRFKPPAVPKPKPDSLFEQMFGRKKIDTPEAKKFMRKFFGWMQDFVHEKHPVGADAAMLNRSITDENSCSTLRGMAWLVYNMGRDGEPLPEMGELPEKGTKATEQKGPAVRLVRTLMIWARMMQIFRFQLENTWEFDKHEQTAIAKCYTDYALEVTSWLAWLKLNADKFPPKGEAICAVNDNLRLVYREYQLIAMRLYGQKDSHTDLQVVSPYRDWKYLLDARFPVHLPDYWDSGLLPPKAGVAIGDWVRDNDPANPRTGPFKETIEAFKCKNHGWKPLKVNQQTTQIDSKGLVGRPKAKERPCKCDVNGNKEDDEYRNCECPKKNSGGGP